MKLPERVDRYEIRSTLGTGAMGAVYLAWDPKLHRDVAIKVLLGEVSRDPKVRKRFQREARAVAALRHPNIVEIYDYSGEESEQLYIVMEKLEGDDLFNIVADNGPMPEPIVAAVGHELCLALGVAHTAGIIHRDLNPENVFISPNGRVVLTDFGIVKAIREDSAVDGGGTHTDIIGTPGFMPPELMMNKPLGPYTDVFALGAMLYNIATGKLPYDGPGPVEMFKSMMKGEFEDPRLHNDFLSDELYKQLAMSLEPRPKRRLQSVDELREGLKEVLAGCGVTDLRDEMREYMSGPRAYWTAARSRAASHVVQRIKIAVKDRDHAQAQKLQGRLEKLDPHNEEVRMVTGLLRLPPLPDEITELEPEPVVLEPAAPPAGEPAAAGGGRFLWVAVALAVVALAGAVAFLVSPQELPAPETAGAADPKKRPRRPAADEPEPLSPPAARIAEAPAPAAGEAAPDGGERPGEGGGEGIADGPESTSRLLATGGAARPGMGQVEVVVRGGMGSLFVDGERVGRIKRQATLELSEGKHLIEVRTRTTKLRKRVDVAPGAPVTVLVELGRGRISQRE